LVLPVERGLLGDLARLVGGLDERLQAHGRVGGGFLAPGVALDVGRRLVVVAGLGDVARVLERAGEPRLAHAFEGGAQAVLRLYVLRDAERLLAGVGVAPRAAKALGRGARLLGLALVEESPGVVARLAPRLGRGQ